VNFDQDKLGLDFVKHRKKYFMVSGVLIGLGILILAFMGLNLGVDFKSGTFIEVLSDKPFIATEVNDVIEEQGFEGEVTLAGDQREIATILFGRTLSPEEVGTIGKAFKDKYGDITIGESTVSSQVARELARDAVYAIIIASIGIIIYVAIRFEYRFAVAGIIALFHDAFFTVAAFSILRLEVDLSFIAAILTIVGYSINDTIVVFDRIRENLRLIKVKTEADLAALVNRSIVETLARSINTTLTVLFAAFTLFIFGSESIRNFSLALLIGLLSGAYSSIFIASQIWLVWKSREIRNKLYQTQ
jgi:preprotein translocase subunit SecF